MKQRTRKATRRSVRYGVLATALVAATLGGLSNSSAAPNEHPINRDQAVAAFGPAKPATVAAPALALPPDSDYAITGSSGLAPAMKSVKAQQILHLSVSLGALFIANNAELNRTGGFLTAIPARQPTCATAADHAIDSYIPVDMYAVSTAKGAQPIGQFAPSKVSMLAFGSIPVTAVVHLSQVVKNNKLQPIRVVQYTPVTAPACDPNWTNEVPPFLNLVQGDVTLTVTDVTVDEVPLNVGSNCHAASPLHLNLWGGPDPVYNYAGGGTLVQKPDSTRVNGYLLHPGSSGLTIPAFAGCNNSGDDVSRLITAMISGPGNELRVAQAEATQGGFDPNDPTACYDTADQRHVCPLPAPPYPTFP